MTNEQTLEQFLLALNSNAYLGMCECSDMQNAIKALEKQIPKKPIAKRETLLGKIFSDRIISFTCPNCNHQDIGNNEFRYPCCEECGQALDWSDYNG